MEWRLFGGLSVARDGRPVDLGGRKQRAVLGVLLLDANRAVPVDDLIERVWAGAPPPRAESSLQAYISHLRRVLEPDRPRGGPASVLVTDPAGYRVVVPRDELDITLFEDLCAEGTAALAAGDPAAAVDALDRALALWAPLLPELDGEQRAAEVAARLDAIHAGALESAVEAKLALGRHREVIADLEGAIVAHPFRERLRAQLALALYRDGRQTDALRSLADARRTLVDEVGVEPGPELRQLESDILAHAPALAAPAAPAPPPPAPAATVAPGPAGLEPLWAYAGRPPEAPCGLVGRSDELSVLVDSAVAAARGSGRAVVISGEPGIGKTRLVEELVAMCGAEGPFTGPPPCEEMAGERGHMAVAWARCTEAAAGAPFWAYTQIAQQLRDLGVLDEQAVVRINSAGGHAHGVDPGADRLALHSSIAAALRTATRPLLVVVDDLQWADASSLRAIEHLAGELRTMPVLLVLTVRPLDPEPPAGLIDCLGELARQAGSQRVELGGLRTADVATWLEARHGDPVPDTVARLVHERTGGNPFFVGEVIELLARQQRLGDPDGPGDLGVPAAVHDVVRRRISLLPVDTQRLLTVASVLGGTIEVDVLARVAERPVHETLELLDPAVAAGLLLEDRSGPGRLRFAHTLVADALVAELSLARRARLHAAVTEALEALRGATLDEHLPELVHHAREGALAGTAERAVEYAARAARRAEAEVGYEDAAAYWDEALRVLDLARPGDQRARYDVLVELGAARLRADDVEGSQRALLEAIGIAEALGDDAAALRAAASLPPSTLWQASGYGVVNTEVVAALERVLARLGDEPTPERADILGALSEALYFGSDPGRSDRLAEQAVAVARRTGDPETLARALNKRYQALWRRSTPHERRAVAEELVGLSRQRSLSPHLDCLAHLSQAAIAFELGERTTFGSDLARCRALADRSRSPGHLSQIAWLEASWLMAQGRYDEAESLAREAHRLHRRTRGWGADEILATYLAAIAHDRGRGDGTLDQLAGLMDTNLAPAVRELAAWMLTESGRLDDARALVGPPGAVTPAPDDWLWLATRTIAAHVRAALGDAEAAGALYDELAPSAGQLVLAGSGGPPLGAVDLALARLAATLGDDGSARLHAAAAVDLLEHFGARPWLARALLTQGELIARSPEHGGANRAVEILERSRAVAAEVGLVPVLRALDAAGLATSSVAQAGSKALGA